ncbi:tRNA-binding [Brachionus plicatilis]|uniref:tRNA-binding n=1 Tax=Brachionus plicatilis TaxID=10195 RepID=A0A3M7R8N4_BRAPC|nr:tRNA-binding [Brachionus plicatilis]
MIKLSNRFQHEKPLITIDTLKKLSFQVGTITKVSPIKKSKKPSFEMESRFENSTIKKSCGQFVRNYTIDELNNKQVFALTNLPPVRIAGIKSEYLTLGFPDEQKDGQAIGISPLEPVQDGQEIIKDISTNYQLQDKISFIQSNDELEAASSSSVNYQDFDSVEIKSGTLIDIISTIKNEHLFGVIHLGNESYTIAYIPGKINIQHSNVYIGLQVPVITNLEMPQLNEYFDFKSMLLVVPKLDNEENKNLVTLLKIDKKVENGLNIF